MSDKLGVILQERGSAYGSIVENCKAAQSLVWYSTGEKISLRAAVWVIIGHKASRSLVSPEKEDHYDDIAGYGLLKATLDEVQKEGGSIKGAGDRHRRGGLNQRTPET